MSPAHRACCFIRRMPAQAGSWKAASHLAWRLRRLTHAQPPSPRPLPPAGEGARKPPREAAALTNRRPSAAMARVDFSPPLWPCREAQGVGRAWAAQQAHASCSDSLRLFERSAQARSEFRSAAPRPSIAGCPQRSEGTRPVGSPFFAYFLWRDKESRSPAGANSRPAAPPPHYPSKARQSPNGSRRNPFSAWNCSPPSSSSPPSPSP